MKHVIIGTSAAGIAAAQKLRELDDKCTIMCISQESEMPHNKCFIADVLSEEIPHKNVFTLSASAAQEKNIELLLGTKVVTLTAGNKKILLESGAQITYDKLLLATGTAAFIPEIPGIKTDGVFTFHTLADLTAIVGFLKNHSVQNVVVIGAGINGLEVADALNERGCSVTVIDRGSRAMADQIDEQGACLLHKMTERANVRLECNSTVSTVFSSDDNMVSAVQLDSGEMIACQMLVVSVGGVANLTLAMHANLDIVQNRIMVNDFMQTSDSSIFAAGDVALVTDRVTGKKVPSVKWSDAMMQGMCAAYAMVGKPRHYSGACIATRSEFFGIKILTCGPLINPPKEYQVIEKKKDDFYGKYLLDASGKLKGFLELGNTLNVGLLRRSILNGQPLNRNLLE